MPQLPTSEEHLQYQRIADRLGTYVSRRNANLQNEREARRADVQPGYTPRYNQAAYFSPHAKVEEYTEEPNNGVKSGFRPIYFFDLDESLNPTVDVTVSGEFTVGAQGSFSVTAYSIDPTTDLSQFLSDVELQIGNGGPQSESNISITVERDDTCLGITGAVAYEITNVQVGIS